MRNLPISLVRRCDFSADIDQLYLHRPSPVQAGYEIPYDGYVPKVSPLTGEPVEESIALNLIGSDDEIVHLDELLDQKEKECAWAPDAAERYQVWLRVGELQAMIGSLRKEAGSAPDFPTTDGMESGRQLGYRRAPFEAQSPLDVILTTGLYAIGSKAQVSSAVPGALPARLAEVILNPHSGSGALAEYWWGLKSTKNGTPGDFTTPWNLQGIAGGQLGADTTIEEDIGVEPHFDFVVDFATVTAMATRFYGRADDISAANYEDLRGTYRILMRMKVSAGFTVRVQMYSGFGPGTYVYGNPVTVTSTSFYLYDMGQITLPCGGPGSISALSAMRRSRIGLEVEYVAGTIADLTGLTVDTCLVPIPVDEGCGHVKNSNGEQAVVLVDALGRVTSYDYTNGVAEPTGVLDTTGVTARDSVVPKGNAYIVVAAQRAAISYRLDQINVELFAYPRWRMPR